jgi:tyrosine-protein kinase Etk/Wzc
MPGPGMPPQPAGMPADEEIDFLRLLGTIWRGKIWLVLGALLGVTGAALNFANTPKTFQADAILQLEESATAIMLPSVIPGMGGGETRTVREIELLRSRLVLGRAVSDLNLDWRVQPVLAPGIGVMLSNYRLAILDPLIPDEYARFGERLTLSELVVPPGWVNAALPLEVTGPGTFTLRLPSGEVLDGVAGTPLERPEGDFRLNVERIDAPPGRRFVLSQIAESQAIAALRGRVSVAERGRGSGILDVRVTGPDRLDNPRVLNAILASYQRQNIARSAAQAEGGLNFIREQLPLAEANLRDAESALNSFRQQQVSVDLSFETQTILSQITRIEGELDQLQRREDELALRFTPAHPTYRLLLDERARLSARQAELRAQIGELPETQRQIVNLTRDLELAQRLHLQLLTRAQEVEVLRASTIGNVRIVDLAEAGSVAVAPRSARFLGMGLLVGLLGGLAVILLRTWLRRGLQDPRELERMGLPVLATINYNRSADMSGRRRGALPILAIEEPVDLTVESLRSLRTSLHFGMLDAATPTLTITSPHPGAGKSFVATNLAVVMAQAGQRVCLIDADMRRGLLRRYVGQPRNTPGLAEVLAGDAAIEEVLLAGPVDGLYVLTAGRYPPNPSELLMRAEMARLVAWCSARFHLTIFDSPPALAVTDPAILARATGATVVVARHDMTQRAELDAMLATFSSAGLKVSGAIMNAYDPRKAGAGYGYGYGYGYGGGYRYAYQTRKD